MRLLFGNTITTVTTIMILALLGFIGASIWNRSNITVTAEKAGGTGVSANVPQDVSQDVPQEVSLKDRIRDEVVRNNKITQSELAEKLGVSRKTVSRNMKEMQDIHYVGSGYSGHWEVE